MKSWQRTKAFDVETFPLHRVISINDGHGFVLAHVNAAVGTDGEKHADLITAAPALLAQLRQIVAVYDAQISDAEDCMHALAYDINDARKLIDTIKEL